MAANDTDAPIGTPLGAPQPGFYSYDRELGEVREKYVRLETQVADLGDNVGDIRTSISKLNQVSELQNEVINRLRSEQRDSLAQLAAQLGSLTTMITSREGRVDLRAAVPVAAFVVSIIVALSGWYLRPLEGQVAANAALSAAMLNMTNERLNDHKAKLITAEQQMHDLLERVHAVKTENAVLAERLRHTTGGQP